MDREVQLVVVSLVGTVAAGGVTGCGWRTCLSTCSTFWREAGVTVTTWGQVTR